MTPVLPPPADNPVSPKTKAAILWAVLGPVIVALITTLISWVATDDGQAWLKAMPDWLQLLLTALVAAASAGIAAYRVIDPLRQRALAYRQI